MAGEKVEDVDGVSTQATALLADIRIQEAVELLEKLRKNQFKPGDYFPALDDLAFAHDELGNYDLAEGMYKEVMADARFPILERKEAEAALPSLATKKRIKAIRLACGLDYQQLADRAIALHKELPKDHDALTFRIEGMDRAGRYDDVVSLMREMRAAAPEQAAWPWEPTLAYAQYGARRFEDSLATFQAIQKNEAFDPRSRMEAENMILEIQVQREVEKGMFALQNINLPAAKETLEKLEDNYSRHQDTLGYKALYMAKTGKSEDALKLLFEKKKEVETQGLPFSQQDALADVFYERKEFDLARIATQQILADPRYDDKSKEAAVKQLRHVIIGMYLHDGSLALRDGDREKAALCLQKAQNIDPASLEVRLFEAEVGLAYSRYTESREELIGLRRQWNLGPFPGLTALADAHAQTGRWEEAAALYREQMTSPGANAQDVWNAQWQYRSIAPLHHRYMNASVTAQSSPEGQLFSSNRTFLSSWNSNIRLGAWLTTDTIHTTKQSAVGSRKEFRWEGGGIFQKRWGEGYFAEAKVGGSNNDVVYGMKVGKMAFQSLGWALSWEGNGRSLESLAVQALNGRQNTLNLNVGGQFANRFILDSNIYYQNHRIGSERLAEGFGASVSLDYILQLETKTRPQITIGYQGEYHRMNTPRILPPRIREEVRHAGVTQRIKQGEEVRRAVAADFGNSVVDDLVDPLTHRHGIELRISKNYDDWGAYVMIGSYYSVDDNLIGIVGAAGLQYWVSDRTTLYAELRVDTNGQAANTGGLIYEANVGAMRQF
jgi:tetratricopeptide (TPR) repeat protein